MFPPISTTGHDLEKRAAFMAVSSDLFANAASMIFLLTMCRSGNDFKHCRVDRRILQIAHEKLCGFSRYCPLKKKGKRFDYSLKDLSGREDAASPGGGGWQRRWSAVSSDSGRQQESRGLGVWRIAPSADN